MQLPEDALTLKAAAAQFAQEVLRPASLELDALAGDTATHPRFTQVLREAFGIGFQRMPYPVELGGLGASPVAVAVALEELAFGDAGFAHTLMANFALSSVAALGSQELKGFVQALCSDESGTYLVASAGSEPQAGSDIFNWLSPERSDVGAQAVATRDGDCWVLRGHKRFVSNAGLARVYVVLAKGSASADMREAGLFVVPAATPGVKVSAPWPKTGQRCSVNADLVLEDARIPVSHRLALPAPFLTLQARGMAAAHVQQAALCVGVARAVLELTVAHVNTRRQGGAPLSSHQAVGLRLADMAMKVESARALYLCAASGLSGEPLPGGGWAGSLAKVHASEVAQDVCQAAAGLLGARSCVRGELLEKLRRDVEPMAAQLGANDVLRLLAAQRILLSRSG